MTPLEPLFRSYPPNAARFIVTVYGDVVEPRGGVLWMGDLIRLCKEFSLNESLVRTAVSRLVSKGQLESVRDGRRSYYSLTSEARAGFQAAARKFFGTPAKPTGWAVAIAQDGHQRTALLEAGFAELSGGVFAGPDRLPAGFAGPVIRGRLDGTTGTLERFLSDTFALQSLSEDYRLFITRFEALDEDLADLAEIDGYQALKLRLALIHEYRKVRLRDPALPGDVLPEWWMGGHAKLLFARLYTALSVQADVHIASAFHNRDGLLDVSTAAVGERLRNLSLW